jgi:hypothetical protein
VTPTSVVAVVIDPAHMSDCLGMKAEEHALVGAGYGFEENDGIAAVDASMTYRLYVKMCQLMDVALVCGEKR